ncbi:hypothetical protein BDY21DRAFT_294399 [Lineolata rhizophorae]|uniref:LDB19 N-terminal domain-containing protein n=1 Tax=Lineolata rhizophorae TaxID=578093 RepID=A0A6A6NLM6_9PEZI|nr:hypothetical protein BDY21DRAFT_294399 [Lineolata rhizophorae]
MDHLRRHSLTRLHHHSDRKSGTSPKASATSVASGASSGGASGRAATPPTAPAELSIVIESPPVVLYGSPRHSTGALFAGQLVVDVARDAEIALGALELAMVGTVTTRRPVGGAHCPDCVAQSKELKRWEFVGGEGVEGGAPAPAPAPLRLAQGRHTFPFSYLVPGHLPATSAGHIGGIAYKLEARARTTGGEALALERPVKVARAIIPMPENERHSLRIFPPTAITAQVTLPAVIHPIGDFGVEMAISGVASTATSLQNTPQRDASTRWRLRKLTWRLDERERHVSPACARHAAKVGGAGKGMQHEDVRTVGGDEVKGGWKSDFATGDGRIEVAFSARVNPAKKSVCDVDSPTGFVVTHALVIEMVVAEEWVSKKRPNSPTPTGAARVLRTQFNVTLTERSGLGIAWDEEQPPTYEDVPASPPTYNQVRDVDLAELDEEAERLHLAEES